MSKATDKIIKTWNLKDVEFMSASDKALTLKDWLRFIEKGCKPEHFTNRLYNHLIQHCSFIAHYDRGGFYHTYFTTPEMTNKFLRQFDRGYDCVSHEYGMDYWIQGGNDVCASYYDINNAMVDIIKPLLQPLYNDLLDQHMKGLRSSADEAAANAGGRFVPGR